MGTKARRTTAAMGIAGLLGIAGVAAAPTGGDSAVSTTPAPAVARYGSADSLERRAVGVLDDPADAPTCANELSGSVDAAERRAEGCRPGSTFRGSPDAIEHRAVG